MVNKCIFHTNAKNECSQSVGIGHDLGVSYKCYGFGTDRSKVKVRIMVRLRLPAIRPGFKLYECLLVLRASTSVQR